MTTGWRAEFLNQLVENEFLDLPKDMQARFIRIIELMELHGLENLGMPYVRHLQGKLWEMRAKGETGISRSLYIALKRRRDVILRVFVKKTQQTPKTEIDLAMARMKELDHGEKC